MKRFGGLYTLAFLGLFFVPSRAAYWPNETIKISWDHLLRTSVSTPSLQVVVNPLLRQGSTIHDAVFANLAKLGADKVRFVPWLPYPRLAVAELNAPTDTTTSWDFSLIDPLVEDFYRATNKHNTIFNFSTIPEWLFSTSWNVGYPTNPNEEDWSYEQGAELRDPSLKDLSDYYLRLYRWYAEGSFVDELGQVHTSGHHYPLSTWEVFNEVDSEHAMTADQYNARYDAVVSALKDENPALQFMGPALEHPTTNLDYMEAFLNPHNHAAGVPVDWVSYHFYAQSSMNSPVTQQQSDFFGQSDQFLETVQNIDDIRLANSPDTKTAINEVGTMYKEDLGPVEGQISADYWQLSGATFAYIFAKLSLLGIDLVSESQLVGLPGQFPSVSMLDWTTGNGNARFWVLKLLIDNMNPGDKLFQTDLSSENIFSLGFRKKDGTQKILVVNKSNLATSIQIDGLVSATAETVDESYAGISNTTLIDSMLALNPWAVSIVTLKKSADSIAATSTQDVQRSL